jgi:hypothetical protein
MVLVPGPLGALHVIRSVLQVPAQTHVVAEVFSVSPQVPPVAVTEAILLLAELQVNVWFDIGLPLLSSTCAKTAWTSPYLRDTEVGVRLMLVGVTGVPLSPPHPAIRIPRRKKEMTAQPSFGLNDDETNCDMHPPRCSVIAGAVNSYEQINRNVECRRKTCICLSDDRFIHQPAGAAVASG